SSSLSINRGIANPQGDWYRNRNSAGLLRFFNIPKSKRQQTLELDVKKDSFFIGSFVTKVVTIIRVLCFKGNVMRSKKILLMGVVAMGF
ncbi:hypothetical protein ACUHMQ_21145, partial [Chitinimonas sp. PSY-7]|uniref:hypothetical protein n=1 Tax=Chitinimonas sp. PSY-7 TaxID=3459088 RepID=UPI00403FFDDE